MPLGKPAPLGAAIQPGGINFSVYARHASALELLLFADAEAEAPERTLELHRTADYWHTFVPDLAPGQIYAYRARGPAGHRFDADKALLDPYGRAVVGYESYDRQAAAAPGDNAAVALRSVVAGADDFDWAGDRPLGPPQRRGLTYEMHVAGFTRDPESEVEPALRGTYAGLMAKIPYLVDLGVTTVELLPVHAFDPQDAPTGRVNYWGYSPVSYFAPHPDYAQATAPAGVVDEFRDMVRVLHTAGLRIILDVVYNHTAEAGPTGPHLCWRGFDEAAYYMYEADFDRYRNYTGCGNTFNANHPVTNRLILDSLRHWVGELHVDGFRFDLATTLARSEDGAPMDRPPVLWAIDTDLVLAGTRLIAEAWDTGGLHLVGNFPGRRFSCWNGPYRDTARRFLKGDGGIIEELMARIVGSPDLFTRDDGQPSNSINFVTCHDGFTLRDLVSYEQKHNLENGEHNRDGSDNNLSWNSGTEGATNEDVVQLLRARRQRNFITLLFLSHGTPMLLAGDEWGQSRRGNNNPWCLDNERNWLDWDLADSAADLVRFVRLTAAFANNLPLLRTDRFWSATSADHQGEISWHGLQPGRPDWTPTSRHLAYELNGAPGQEHVLVLLNTETTARTFNLPPAPTGSTWQLLIDTGAVPPDDFRSENALRQPPEEIIVVPSHTIKVLRSRS